MWRSMTAATGGCVWRSMTAAAAGTGGGRRGVEDAAPYGRVRVAVNDRRCGGHGRGIAGRLPALHERFDSEP